MASKGAFDIYDGHVWFDAGTACGNPATDVMPQLLTVNVPGNPNNVAPPLGSSARAFLAFYFKTNPPWPFVGIPIAANITKIEVTLYTHESVINPRIHDIVGLQNDPAGRTAAQICGSISADPVYTPDTNVLSTPGTHILTFESWNQAVIDFQARLDVIQANNGQGTLWFGIGIKFDNEAVDTTDHRIDIRSEEMANPKPVCKAYY